ncbi:MAG: carboxypeptidase-like regulatory domain-containing protein, partial [Propionicimonas sp.]|nr:carboxypeptidase-like regulatory domain-containing protein [Propionicimonas sp.]
VERHRHPHWLVVTVSLLILMPALAACDTTPTSDMGLLTGVVYAKGGKNAETNPAEAKLTATPTGGDTSKNYTTETASDGSFSLELPAGTYELTGTLITRIPGGQTTPQEVTISAGQTTSVEVFAIHP